MKRDVSAAMIYGLVSVVVGVLLITRGVPRMAGDTTGDEGKANPDLRERSGGSALGGLSEPTHRNDGREMEVEVGPDGLRLAPARDDGPSGARISSSGAGRVEEGGTEANADVARFGRAGLLPESGRKLLALGDPNIQAVADLMSEAGATGLVMEFSLRGVYGHVQRLASFKMLARMNAERAVAMERDRPASEPPDPSGTPTFQWRADIWDRRLKEYVAYVGRDLETRLGIEDRSVLDRMVAIADAMSERHPIAVQPTVPGSEEPAR